MLSQTTKKEALISRLSFLQTQAEIHITSMAAGDYLQMISDQLLVALKMAKELPETEDYRSEDEKTFGIRE